MNWGHFVVARSVIVVRLTQPCSPPVQSPVTEYSSANPPMPCPNSWAMTSQPTPIGTCARPPPPHPPQLGLLSTTRTSLKSGTHFLRAAWSRLSVLVPYSSQQCAQDPLKIIPRAVLRMVSDLMVSSEGSLGVPWSS